jgi:hypothetical protein
MDPMMQPAPQGQPPMQGQPMPPSQQSAPQQGDAMGAQQDAAMAMGGDGQVSPEEQEQSDRLVINGLNLIYDSQTRGRILETLDGNGDPIDGLAATAVSVWQHLLTSAEQSGFKATGDAMMNAGREIFEHLAEYSTRAGLYDFVRDPDALEGAYFRALDDIRVVLQQGGKISPDVAKQDLAKLQEMDQSGELEKKMLALAEKDEAGQQQPEEKQQEPRGRGLMAGVK